MFLSLKLLIIETDEFSEFLATNSRPHFFAAAAVDAKVCRLFETLNLGASSDVSVRLESPPSSLIQAAPFIDSEASSPALGVCSGMPNWSSFPDQADAF